MNSDERDKIAYWVEKHLDDSLAPDEFDELQGMLTQQPEAREFYLDLMHQNAQLQLERVHLSAASLAGLATVPNDSSGTQQRPSRIAVWLPAMLALAASLILIAWWNMPSGEARSDMFIAKIIDSCDAEWGDCTLPTAIGSDLCKGRLKLERGLTTIRFASGAEVTLESPAELEVQTSLRGNLLAGTAVVEVPESAHGFTLSTANVVAIDHGTAFSISIDRFSRASSIEVLDGEVEVQHIGSDASRRLKQKQRIVASTKGLSDSAAPSDEVQLLKSDRAEPPRAYQRRITTADGRGHDATISRGRSSEVLKNNRAELVLIKNAFEDFEQFDRKGYFVFDLGSLGGESISAAKFVLTLRPSGLGFASSVGDCEFVVYGLTDQSADDWLVSQLNWETAPANRDGAAEVDESRARELGRFVIQRGRQHGQVSIEGDELVNFLNADINELVTLIVVRLTPENAAGGLVHGFASGSNSIAAPPALLIKTGSSADLK